MGEDIQVGSDREIESTREKVQIIKWLYNNNKSSIFVYFEPCLVEFPAIDENSDEGLKSESVKLQRRPSFS